MSAPTASMRANVSTSPGTAENTMNSNEIPTPKVAASAHSRPSESSRRNGSLSSMVVMTQPAPSWAAAASSGSGSVIRSGSLTRITSTSSTARPRSSVTCRISWTATDEPSTAWSMPLAVGTRRRPTASKPADAAARATPTGGTVIIVRWASDNRRPGDVTYRPDG